MEAAGDAASLILISVGVFLTYQSRKRGFDRTNQFGLERFATYGAKLRGRFVDHLLAGSGILSMATGMITLASNHMDSWGWIVMAPISVLLLYLLLGT